MDWPEAERFFTEIGGDGRSRLLALLESPDGIRAEAIGRPHLCDDGAHLEELLILLEEKEWARHWMIQAIREGA